VTDARTLGLIGGVLLVLAILSGIAYWLRRHPGSQFDAPVVDTFRRRVRAWLVLFSLLAVAFLVGRAATVVLFGLIGFWALREFITLTPTRPGDHRTLFLVFFFWAPLQFVLIGISLYFSLYGAYSILIPVYAFLIIPAQIALSGDFKRFLERTAKIQAGLLICIYCLSYAPALLTLQLPAPLEPVSLPQLSRSAQAAEPTAPDAPSPAAADDDPNKAVGRPIDAGASVRLLFFFILMVQLSDALQYAWARLLSEHVIVPSISPNKTWEGLFGGMASVALIGAGLWWATPFPYWLAALMSAVVALMGFAGSLTMSAIKRDRGVKDYGTLVEGHGGVLDRIDSLCFAAPIFFHFTRYYLIAADLLPPVT
jgi:phosphatidate cytidylyltransferase